MQVESRARHSRASPHQLVSEWVCVCVLHDAPQRGTAAWPDGATHEWVGAASGVQPIAPCTQTLTLFKCLRVLDTVKFSYGFLSQKTNKYRIKAY